MPPPFLYTKTDITSQNSVDTKKLAPWLKPSVPAIDVIQDFPWTLTPTSQKARESAPVIYLNEYYQLETQLNQSLLPYGRDKVGQGGLTDLTSALSILGQYSSIDANTEYLYEGLFDHFTDRKGFSYKLPYFTESYFDLDNTWQRTDILDTLLSIQEEIGGFVQGGIKNVVDTVKTALKKEIEEKKGGGLSDYLNKMPRILKDIERFNLASQNPAVGLMDPPSVWQSTAQRQYTFQFPLYNIAVLNSSNSVDAIVKNWEICYILTYQNLVNKKNFYSGIPPVFYEVTIPGIHYSKASYISDLSISNVGNIRVLRLPIDGAALTDVNVPDAYMISITLTDFLMPSKNLLDAAVNFKVTSNIIATTTNPLGAATR